jgi:hypothetical protein
MGHFRLTLTIESEKDDVICVSVREFKGNDYR